MEYLRKGQVKYFNSPKIEAVKMEHTLAKKQFAKFFNDEMPQRNRYFYEIDEEAKDYTVYEADPQYKRKIAKPEISAAKYACSTHNKKLFFGKPNVLLLMEDIAARLSLEELKDIMNDCMQTYH